MIVYAKISGDTVVLAPDTTVQGSISANVIDLLAPFPKTAAVAVAVTLPTGQSTTPTFADAKDATLITGNVTGIEEDGKELNIWRYTFQKPLTQFAGSLTIQFFITTSDGATTALTPLIVPIVKGVPFIMPKPDEASWNAVQQLYNRLLDAEQNATDAATAAANSATAAAKSAEDAVTNAQKVIDDGIVKVNAEIDKGVEKIEVEVVKAGDFASISKTHSDDAAKSAEDAEQYAQHASQSAADAESVVRNITEIIPADASADNKLTTESFVNSSIATNTATFRGTYDLTAEQLNALPWQNTDPSSDYYCDNNDYVFLTTKKDGQVISYSRYKCIISASTITWEYEYTLNNSSFTDEQWAAINSGITAAIVNSIPNIHNLSDGAVTGALNQLFDGGDTLDFTGKNPNAVAAGLLAKLGESDITKLTRGATGQYASSFGGKSIAKGKRGHAEGTTTIAAGNYSHAEGDNSVTLGDDSHAEGYTTTAKGQASHSEGGYTITTGKYAHAEGLRTTASGEASHSEGDTTQAKGAYSHAEGGYTTADSEHSHAEGYSTTASGDSSHAEGDRTKAIEAAAHAEGSETQAIKEYAHAEGVETIASAQAAHAEGNNTTASGLNSHAEGGYAKAIGANSHAEGNGTTASGDNSHAEGSNTIASKANSHAEGSGAKAEGTISHAEGNSTTASGDSSHAEGSNTVASGAASHAGGSKCTAAGDYSFAHGDNSIARKANQSVLGQSLDSINLEEGGAAVGVLNDSQAGDLFEVGNGTSATERSNAFRVLKDGRAKVQTAPEDDDDVVRKVDLANVGTGDVKLIELTTPSPTMPDEFVAAYRENPLKFAITVNRKSYSISAYSISSGTTVQGKRHQLSYVSAPYFSNIAKTYMRDAFAISFYENQTGVSITTPRTDDNFQTQIGNVFASKTNKFTDTNTFTKTVIANAGLQKTAADPVVPLPYVYAPSDVAPAEPTTVTIENGEIFVYTWASMAATLQPPTVVPYNYNAKLIIDYSSASSVPSFSNIDFVDGIPEIVEGSYYVFDLSYKNSTTAIAKQLYPVPSASSTYKHCMTFNLLNGGGTLLNKIQFTVVAYSKLSAFPTTAQELKDSHLLGNYNAVTDVIYKNESGTVSNRAVITALQADGDPVSAVDEVHVTLAGFAYMGDNNTLELFEDDGALTLSSITDTITEV